MKKSFLIIISVLVFMMSSIGVFAAEEKYTFNLADGTTLEAENFEIPEPYKYAYIYDSSASYGTIRLVFTSEPLFAVDLGDGTYTFAALEECKYRSFTLSSNGSWSGFDIGTWQYDASVGHTSTFGFKSSPMLWSTVDFKEFETNNIILNADPNFLPPLPLWEIPIQMMEGELMMVTLPALGGTVKVLVLCGVGCLALLAALKLFGKRSLLFRS